MGDFHFIRPLWLWALLPVVLWFVWLWRQKQAGSVWAKVCDPLLAHRFVSYQAGKQDKLPLWLLLTGWIISVLALAGPSWQRIHTPVFEPQDALVIVLDLSISMNAQDMPPSRLQRARRKIMDLLQLRQEGQTALIVYAGDSHIVAPLTPDTHTILSFIRVLSPDLMPAAGKNTAQAIRKAVDLLRQSGYAAGSIALFTDGISKAQATNISRLLAAPDVRVRLSIIGIGSTEGAPIPDKNRGGFVKDADGSILLSRLDSAALSSLAQQNGGYYQTIRLDEADIRPLLRSDSKKRKADKTRLEQWRDFGAYLVYPLVLVALAGFRRGWLLQIVLPLVLLLPLMAARPVHALSWADWWLRADQQAQQAFDAGDYARAANRFEDPLWQAHALYKNRQYQQAITAYQQFNNANADYNIANSYAQLQQWNKALDYYNKALARITPDVDKKHHKLYQDITHNKKLIQEYLKQQQKNQQQTQKRKQQPQGKNKQGQKEKNGQSQKNARQKGKQQHSQQQTQSQQGQNAKNHSDTNKQDGRGQSKQQQSAQQQSAQKRSTQKQSTQHSSTKNNMRQNQKNNRTENLQKHNTIPQSKKVQRKKGKQSHKQVQNNHDKVAKNKKARQQPRVLHAKEQKNKSNAPAKPATAYSHLNKRDKQEIDNYLNQIQDDPAFLLRCKFFLETYPDAKSCVYQ